MTQSDNTIVTPVPLPEHLLRQVDLVAETFGLARNQLFVRAIESFLHHHPIHATQRRVINQGEVYWIALDEPQTGASIPHPYVVVQDNLFNHSRIETVVVCALTSNIRRSSETPGNVLLDAGEANLPKQSVVEVSKVSTVAKSQLGEQIGTLSEQRVAEILAGMRFLQLAHFGREPSSNAI